MKYLTVITIILVGVSVAGCRTTSEKRTAKDIAGINEQLYDLEKAQQKTGKQVREISTEIPQLKDAIEQGKEKEGAGDLEQIYKDGYKFFLEQHYTKAIEQLARLTETFKNTEPLADNALYWQAESYYKLTNVDMALSYYQLVYRYFPFSNKADYSLYKIGAIYLDRKDNSRALLAFTRLVNEYPASDLYKAATIKINQIKKKRRRR